MQKRICIIDGVRTPMSKAGMSLSKTTGDELAVYTLRRLLQLTGIEDEQIDEVIYGNVSMPIEAANIARVIGLKAGLPGKTPGMTVQRNCASGIESVITAARKILLGESEIIVAGGTESMSNIPLIYNQKRVEQFKSLVSSKALSKKIKNLLAMQLTFEKPIVGLEKGLTDPVSGLIMGQTAELLARKFNISRQEQDE
ncbi:MAG: hypothetical protein MI922_14240, partial [Bacteroidales bacterium]|nr:hypothetical protein [Bacteroidales bacterium]